MQFCTCREAAAKAVIARVTLARMSESVAGTQMLGAAIEADDAFARRVQLGRDGDEPVGVIQLDSLKVPPRGRASTPALGGSPANLDLVSL